MAKKKTTNSPKEAAKIFDAIIKASVSGNPKPKIKTEVQFKKGDVLRGKSVKHPFVYWEKGANGIIGVMLTKPYKTYPNNVKLLEEHIAHSDEFEFKYMDTQFLKAKLIKEGSWGPYRKVGELTTAGVNFVSEYVEETVPTNWRKISTFNTE